MPEGQEKTEQATAKHRVQARKSGSVAKSTDLTNSVVILALLVVLPFSASILCRGSLQSMRQATANLPSQVSIANVVGFASAAAAPMLPGLEAIMATVLVVSLATNFAQVGFVFSPESLQPSFSKINPLQGLKRLMSVRLPFEAAKALGKTFLLALLAYLAIKQHWATLNSLDNMPPTAAISVIGDLLRTIVIRVGFAWGALAGLDYFFQRKQMDKQLRMTKEEVKREMREAEMLPEIKAARNQRRRRLMRQRLKDAVRNADVVVTNPTHFAIALKYESGKNHAPMVVAKGADFLAARIREEAAEANVPLIPNPPLARALYKQCEVGDFVPRELFQEVAEVLAHVYKTLRKMPR